MIGGSSFFIEYLQPSLYASSFLACNLTDRVVPDIDSNLRRGRFWAMSTASGNVRLWHLCRAGRCLSMWCGGVLVVFFRTYLCPYKSVTGLLFIYRTVAWCWRQTLTAVVVTRLTITFCVRHATHAAYRFLPAKWPPTCDAFTSSSLPMAWKYLRRFWLDVMFTSG